MIKKYFFNLWITFDQFLNALMAGDPDETVSSREALLVAFQDGI
jgi:hypothetical protein